MMPRTARSPSSLSQRLALALLSLWAGGATLLAQDPRAADLAPGDAQWPTRIPIHTQADDPDGGAYGVWAAGRGFKASFDSGRVAFHPAGADGEAWVWTTESIGGRSVSRTDRATANTRFTEDRFETVHEGGVVEAYDLRDDGIEQSFVFPTRPADPSADLTVVGRIASPWFAPESTGAHGDLTFSSVGTSGVRYGRAFALDASGRRLEIPTRWDGARISLTVPASFVSEASYPLVIDPLIGAFTVHWDTSNRYPIVSVDLVRDDEQNQIYYALTQEVSARDRDLLLYTCTDGFGSPTLVYADITSSWSTEHANVATVGGADKCVTVFHRVFTTSKHSLRWHTRSLRDRNMNTSYGFLTGPSDEHDWLPDVGGTRNATSGNQALVVWQRDRSAQFQNTSNSRVMYAVLDVSGTGQGVLAPESPLLDPGLGFDQEHPRATPTVEGGTGSGWPVVWQEWGGLRGTRTLAWDGRIRRVAANGAVSTGVSYLRPTGNDRAHCLRPSIAGESGRYLVSFAELWTSITPSKTGFPIGNILAAERVDWPGNASTPSFPHPPVRRFLRGDVRYVNGHVAYDTDSRSHWAATAIDTITNTAFAEKMGYRGRSITYGALGGNSSRDPIPGGASFDDDNDRFALGMGRFNPQTLGWIASGYLYTYGNANPPAPYGVGCSTTGATPGWRGTWHVGDEFSGATLTSAPSRTSGVLRFGSAPRQTALNYLGMPGCLLHLDLSRLWAMSVPITTSSRGSAGVSLPLPEEYRPSQLFMQWILLEPGANALGVTTTPGLSMTIVE